MLFLVVYISNRMDIGLNIAEIYQSSLVKNSLSTEYNQGCNSNTNI